MHPNVYAKTLATSVLIGMTGCASTQINSNTFDIARTYDTLITKQVTFNLGKYLKDPESLPAVVKVSNQTATTTNSVTPTFTLPFTDTIARAMTRTITSTGKSVSVAANDQWSQTYSLSPVYDPDQLRRLRTLYQYATSYIDDKFFEVTYPIIEASSGGSGGSSLPQVRLSISVDGKPVTVAVGSPPALPDKKKLVYVRRVLEPGPGNRVNLSYAVVNPDITFIKPPGCVLCDYGNRLSANDIASIKDKSILSNLASVHKLEKNRSLRQDWLVHPGESQSADAIALPSDIGAEALYVRGQAGLGLFYEFALFTEEASVQGTGSPTSGGQSEGRKTSTPQNFNVPVSGAATVVP